MKLNLLKKKNKIYYYLKKIKLCPYGYTQVILSPPIFKGHPMPNIFWLVCPYLLKQVSYLEEKGYIKKFEEKLKKDPLFLKNYILAHEEEKRIRKKLIDLYFKEEFNNLKEKEKKVLIESGIGGIKSYFGVKCLHLHLASFLGGIKNPIGLEVFLSLKQTYCSDINCSNSSL